PHHLPRRLVLAFDGAADQSFRLKPVRLTMSAHRSLSDLTSCASPAGVEPAGSKTCLARPSLRAPVCKVLSTVELRVLIIASGVPARTNSAKNSTPSAAG